MTDARNIRRRPDGSIDTGAYILKGRIRRSEAAHKAAAAAMDAARKPLFGIAGILALLPVLGTRG